jgi:hypothetical protein
MKFYDPVKRNFSLKHFKTGETFTFTLPTIGLSEFLKQYLTKKFQTKKSYDEYFYSVSYFVIPPDGNLTEEEYFNLEVESKNWSLERISAVTKFVDELQANIRPEVKHITKTGATEVTVPLAFQGGFKSLFLIPDIFEQFS